MKSDIPRVNIFRPLLENNGEGNVLAVKGKNGSGKTYLCSCLANTAILKTPFSVAASMRVDKEVLADPRYSGRFRYITSDRDFFQAYLDLPPPMLVILDDFQAKYSSLSVGTSDGKALTSLSLFFRKFQVSTAYILHLDYVPHMITGQNPSWLYKLDRYSFYVPEDADAGMLKTPKEIRNHCLRVDYPPWFKPLPYGTYSIPAFDITLDLQDMYSYLSHMEHGDLRQGVRDYLAKADKAAEARSLAKEFTWADVARIIKAKLEDKGKKFYPNLRLDDIIPPKLLYGRKKVV